MLLYCIVLQSIYCIPLSSRPACYSVALYMLACYSIHCVVAWSICYSIALFSTLCAITLMHCFVEYIYSISLGCIFHSDQFFSTVYNITLIFCSLRYISFFYFIVLQNKHCYSLSIALFFVLAHIDSVCLFVRLSHKCTLTLVLSGMNQFFDDYLIYISDVDRFSHIYLTYNYIVYYIVLI